jgi:hypothetical protein
MEEREAYLAQVAANAAIAARPEENPYASREDLIAALERAVAAGRFSVAQQIQVLIAMGETERAEVLTAISNSMNTSGTSTTPPPDETIANTRSLNPDWEGVHMSAPEDLSFFYEPLPQRNISVDQAFLEAQMNGRLQLSAEQRRALFAETQSWFNNAPYIPGISPTQGTSIVGRLYLGLLQKLSAAISEQEATQYAFAVQSVTSIPKEKIIAIYRAAKTDAGINMSILGPKLRELFITGNYAHLFEGPQSPEQNTTARVLSAVTDKTVYHDGNVRIRFDIATEGKEVSKIEVYRADGTSPIALGSVSHTFAMVSLNQFAGCEENVQLRIKVYFKDGTRAEGLTGTFFVEKLLPDANQKIVNYLRDTLQPTLEKVSDTEWEAAEEGGGGTCKVWVQTKLMSAVYGNEEGRPTIPANKITTNPDGTKTSIYHEWEDDEDVLKISSYDEDISGNNEIANQFSEALAGDFLQMEIKFSDGSILPHTAVFDRTDANGIWVYDSNWNDPMDGTVRWHHFSWEYLSDILQKMTVYRIK